MKNEKIIELNSHETRIALLEQSTIYLKESINDIKAILYKLDSKIDTNTDRLDNKIDSNFKWLLGIMLTGFGGLAGIMAHGFHWI